MVALNRIPQSSGDSGDMMFFRRSGSTRDTPFRRASAGPIPQERFFQFYPDRIHQRVSQLVQQWRRETGHLSSILQKINHPAYQEIIAIGEPALPALFNELQVRPSHWFIALEEITGENPVLPGASFDNAVLAWVLWGYRKGLVQRLP